MPESHFGFMARKKPRAQPHPQPLPPGLVVRGPRPLEIWNEDDVAWQRRCAKRNTAVQDIVKRRGEGALSLAPNPDDRTLNKRTPYDGLPCRDARAATAGAGRFARAGRLKEASSPALRLHASTACLPVVCPASIACSGFAAAAGRLGNVTALAFKHDVTHV